MEPSKKTKIKICCIMSLQEAKLAITYGASAIGLVSAMPSGPGVIPEDRIKDIIHGIPENISTFLLTSAQRAEDIIIQQKKCKATTIQICDRLERGGYDDIRRAIPGIFLVQVIHVNGKESIDEAAAVSQFVDYILLDSGNQSLLVKELGGTGKTHDWSISKTIREKLDIPVYLAGGLNSSNVSEAIEMVRPYGVDVCSGIRTHNRLDEIKLAHFTESVRGTFV
ncbi:MAG: phosphoribosylanthranilate isomerase [Spirochaetales bacterium]|nr:phosphoribosylanthranilate isomerase [Spirochaetales bacterium]